MAQVSLFKKVGTYIDKETGEEKPFKNFYVRCGDELVPIEVKFYKGEDGHDYRYNGRKSVLSAFAEELPDKPDNGKKSGKAQSQPVPVDDGDIPF